MKNNARLFINTLLVIIAVILIILGVSVELYWISLIGGLIFIIMILLRSIQIKKLNKEINDIKGIKPHDADDHKDE